MGVQGDINDMRPRLAVERPLHPDGHLYEMGWGSEPVGGTGMGHVATKKNAELFTAAQWASITAAAVQGVSQMEVAIAATPMASAYTRAKAAAVAGGVLTFALQTRNRWKAYHGAPLSSVWITA